MAKAKKTAATLDKMPKKPSVPSQPVVTVKTAQDVAAVTAPPPRAIILIRGGDKDVQEATLTDTRGLFDALKKLGKKMCYIQLLMRGKVHEMTRKYHPETKEPNPFYDKVIKYSARSGWVNQPSQDVLDRWLKRRGEESREVQEHLYAGVADPRYPLVREHETEGTLYLAFNPNEGFHYNESLVHKDTFEEVTREDLEPYCGDKKSTWFKNVKLSSIIEVKGGYWKMVFGEKRWIRFRFRNLDNITNVETAIADSLPLITEQASDYVNEDDD